MTDEFEEYLEVPRKINWRAVARDRKEWRRGVLGALALKEKERKENKMIKKTGAITIQNQLRLSSQNFVFKVHWLGPVNVGA